MTILIGTSQYLMPTWSKTYFPADLPQDWRLDYYANDYPIVFFDNISEKCANKLTADNWPESLQLVYSTSSINADFTDNKHIFQLIKTKADVITLVSDNPEVCKYYNAAGIGCLLWHKVDDAEYVTLHNQENQRRIVALHDDEKELRQLRDKLAGYDTADQETWVFLDSQPARLEQIGTMLDLMGIRG